MHKFLLLFSILIALFSPHSFAAEPEPYFLTGTLETDACFISFLESSGKKFVVKQIKDPTPDEQFVLVLDALGCHIAETANILMNKVTIIPSSVNFTGKSILKFPATLHTLALGVSIDQECLYHDIDVHQRFRKKNSLMWHRWGPLAPEKTGLTVLVIQNMAKHSDLPKLVALDTFVGNADRSPPNLYYDRLKDRFCGIDMASSFTSPLGFFACRQLKGMKRNYFTNDELSALINYAHTLEFLIKNWPPEKQERLLLEYSEIAGFKNGSLLFDQNVAERVEFHTECIKDNYKNCVKLIKLINQIILPSAS